MSNQNRYSKTFNQLCHMVALSKDGKTEAAIDNLVLTLFGIDEKFTPTSTQEFIEAINVYFNLSLSEQLIEASIQRLLENTKLRKHEKVYTCEPKTLSEIRIKISAANMLEVEVRDEWFASFKNFGFSIPPEWYNPLWSGLKNYMARAFHRHGIETTLLLYPKYEITEEDRKHLSTYLQEAISQTCAEIPTDQATKIIGSFFTDTTDLRSKYVSHLLDATFTYFALTIDETAHDYLNSNIPDLALFLDTNFIFGLLDLSSSPLVDVTKELVRIIQDNNLPFKLYYHEKTLEEFLNAIEAVGNRLKGRNWSQALSKAATRASQFSGVELEYHKKNAVTPISPEIFLSKFEHAIDLLDSLGFTIYRSSGNNKQLNDKRYELTLRYGDYIKQNRKRGEKHYEVLNHDIVLWQTVDQLRKNGSSVLDARAFILSIDYYFYSYDWQYLRQSTNVGKVLLPNNFLQILRPFLQVNDNLNKYFVETFAIPEFRAMETDYSSVNSQILSYLSTYREVKEETAIRMLTNTLLKDRLQDKDGNSQEFKDLIDNALIEENTKLLEQIENLTEETQASQQLAKEQASKVAQKEKSLGELQKEYEKIAEISQENSNQISKLEKNLELERQRIASTEADLLESQKERVRYKFYLRISLGLIITLVGIAIIFFSFPQISWISEHPNRNGLYLAASLLIIGIAFLVADTNLKRKGLVFGGIILAVIIELIQVL